MNRSKDLTGLKFERWTVIERVADRGTSAKPRKCYLCRCDCGIEKIVFAENLTGGKSLSCGCLARERTSAATFEDLTGKRFGRLLALERAPGIGKWKQTAFWCRCDCGGELVAVRATLLVGGVTTSCGCVRREVSRRRLTRHGHAAHGKRSLLYRMYRSMMRRCCSPTDPKFKDYGGRGIGVCAAWLESFQVYAADVAYYMGPRPSPRHTIDRIDNDKGYFPRNVHWATPEQQARNTRRNRRHTLYGETLVQVAWAERFGISQSKLSRLLRSGRTIEQVALLVGYLPPRKPPVTVGAAAPLHKRKSS